MLKKINHLLKSRHIKKQKEKLKDSSYEFIFDDAVPEHYVCFDCETTGLDRKKDSIITLSAIKIIKNDIQTSQSLNLTIKQTESINEESILVHHIRNVDVYNSQFVYTSEQEAIGDFLSFIHQSTLIGYYLEFDVAMVNRILLPWLGVALPHPKIEVSNLYYQHAQEKQKRSCIEPNIDLGFESILRDLDIPNLGQHDAYNDALMTALIFLKLKNTMSISPPL